MKKLILMLWIFTIATASQGQIINVPGDFLTIQEGIDAASQGDTVLVSDGTYYEQINFHGKKPLTVASLYLVDGDPGHISGTVIDGSQLSDPENASVVYFTSLEDTTCVLCGFTIQGGRGTYITDNQLVGGGIYIRSGGPTLRDNIIRNNSLDDQNFSSSNGVLGGGIYIFNLTTRWSKLQNNTISDNSVTTLNVNCGAGGLFLYGNAILENNTFSGNSSYRNPMDPGQAFAGAIYFSSYTTPPKQLILLDNVFENNSVYGVNAYGGGIGVSTGKLVCKGNIFSGNSISGSGPESYGGGGMMVYNPDEGSEISGNRFMNNVSASNGGGLWVNGNNHWQVVENNYFYRNSANYGGAVCVSNASVTLQNNVYYGNESELAGGALYLQIDSPVDGHTACLINNSFYGNIVSQPSGSGGAIYCMGVNPVILNSVFWQDEAASVPEIRGNCLFIELAYSNVDPSMVSNPGRGIIMGNGMINADPQFIDTLLNVTAESPCIDLGTESYSCHDTTWQSPLYDIDELIRPWPELFDIGAHEYGSSQVGIRDAKPVSNLDITNYPNPFRNATAFEYVLDKDAFVRLTIYNQAGQEIDELCNGQQSAGQHRIEWNQGSLPSGIYFYKIKTGDNRYLQTGKLVKL